MNQKLGLLLTRLLKITEKQRNKCLLFNLKEKILSKEETLSAFTKVIKTFFQIHIFGLLLFNFNLKIHVKES